MGICWMRLAVSHWTAWACWAGWLHGRLPLGWPGCGTSPETFPGVFDFLNFYFFQSFLDFLESAKPGFSKTTYIVFWWSCNGRCCPSLFIFTCSFMQHPGRCLTSAGTKMGCTRCPNSGQSIMCMCVLNSIWWVSLGGFWFGGLLDEIH